MYRIEQNSLNLSSLDNHVFAGYYPKADLILGPRFREDPCLLYIMLPLVVEKEEGRENCALAHMFFPISDTYEFHYFNDKSNHIAALNFKEHEVVILLNARRKKGIINHVQW